MGLAWVPDDTRRAVVPASGREWNSGPRHRRPTLLARSGQAVACRITALAARTDTDTAPPECDAGNRHWIALSSRNRTTATCPTSAPEVQTPGNKFDDPMKLATNPLAGRK